MTTPITLHDAGDESNHQDIQYREIVGLHGIESVVPSSGSWIADDHKDPPTFDKTSAIAATSAFLDKQRQIHKEGAD